jgi:TonB family protein
MNTIARQILPVLTLTTVCFAGALQSAEPTFKQEPDDLRPYFVKKPLPTYPQAAFTWHRQGSGWFRLNIDPATGKITSVKVLKSTGVKILDDSAAVAFMQWRAKPHLIDHAILPANFVGAHGDNKSIKW